MSTKQFKDIIRQYALFLLCFEFVTLAFQICILQSDHIWFYTSLIISIVLSLLAIILNLIYTLKSFLLIIRHDAIETIENEIIPYNDAQLQQISLFLDSSYSGIYNKYKTLIYTSIVLFTISLLITIVCKILVKF